MFKILTGRKKIMAQQEEQKKPEGSFKTLIIVGLSVLAVIQLAIYAFLRING